MTERTDSWVVLLVSGCALNVVGILLLDTMAWYVQYSVLGLSILLLLGAAVQSVSDSPIAIVE